MISGLRIIQTLLRSSFLSRHWLKWKEIKDRKACYSSVQYDLPNVYCFEYNTLWSKMQANMRVTKIGDKSITLICIISISVADIEQYTFSFIVIITRALLALPKKYL